MDICVFCSANAEIAPAYVAAAAELGDWIGRNGHKLVFGGCNMGLMETVARAAHEAGGIVIGVVPTIIEEGGRVSEYVDVRMLCDTLSDRKDLMIQRSDAIIALPGGIGTLDEIFTVLAASSIGYHDKSVILFNVDAFWQPLLGMLAALKEQGMLRDGFDRHLFVMDDIAQLERFLP